jgi:succinoglycan biosynthesis transport protein ExoP
MSDSIPRFDLDMEDQGGGLPAQLRDPVGVFKRGWRWSLIAFVLLIIPTILASRLIPLEFEATSRLMLTNKAIPDAFVADTIVASGSQQFEAVENQVLARESLREIVETYNAFAKERETRTMASVIDGFRNAIQIEKEPVLSRRGIESSIAIQVSLRGRESQLVADLVNSITAELINEFLDYRSEQSQVASDFMRREFESADESLRQHQRTLAVFRERYRGSLPEEQVATVGRLERLESQRRSIILQNNDARAELSMSGTTTSLEGGTVVVPPRERMQIELNRLLGIYTEEHPQIQSLRNRIAALEEPSSNGPSSMSNARTRLENEIAERRLRLDEIDAEVKRLELQVARTSEITEEYRALERKEVMLQEAYSDYHSKLKSAELSRSMEMAQQGTQLFRLEAARPPAGPIIPRVVFTAAALIVTLVGSLFVGVVREILNPVVIDSAHLEEITSLPSLGSIPRIAGSA